MNDNYDVSIFIVTDDDVIFVDDYLKEDGDGRFVMLTNDMLNNESGDDNTIFVSRRWNYFVSPDNVCDSILKRQEVFNVYDNQELSYSQNSELTSYGFPPLDVDVEFSLLLWQFDKLDIPNVELLRWKKEAEYDFNGYKNTIQIMNKTSICVDQHNQIINDSIVPTSEYDVISFEQMFPSIYTAYNSHEMYNNQIIKGFLPSAGQLYTMAENNRKLNKALEKIDAIKCLITLRYWWSSSISSQKLIWILSNGQISKHQKNTNVLKTFPIFHLILQR